MDVAYIWSSSCWRYLVRATANEIYSSVRASSKNHKTDPTLSFSHMIISFHDFQRLNQHRLVLYYRTYRSLLWLKKLFAATLSFLWTPSQKCRNIASANAPSNWRIFFSYHIFLTLMISRQHRFQPSLRHSREYPPKSMTIMWLSTSVPTVWYIKSKCRLIRP